MSRLKIREISARVANLERLQRHEIERLHRRHSLSDGTMEQIVDRQERCRNEVASVRMEQALALQTLRHESEEEQRRLRQRLTRAERLSFWQALTILMLIGAWLWTQQ